MGYGYCMVTDKEKMLIVSVLLFWSIFPTRQQELISYTFKRGIRLGGLYISIQWPKANLVPNNN